MKTYVWLLLALIFGTIGTTNGQSLTGTWTTWNEQISQPVNTVFLENGFFRSRWGNGDNFTIPTYGWGAYSIRGKNLILQYFTGEQHEYAISGHNGREMTLTYTEDGTKYPYQYQGAPSLEEWEKVRIISESNFHKLTGTWICGGERLMFLGDGAMFARDGDQQGVLYRYVTEGNTLRLQQINEMDEYFFSADLNHFNAEGFTLEIDGKPLRYVYEGPVQLASDEQFLYQNYLAVIHRTNMSTIDAMDGVRDFIWKRVDENGRVID